MDVPENTPEAKISQEKEAAPVVENSVISTEEKTEDPNWRAFREARKKDRLERELAEKRAAEKEAEVAALKAAMEAAFNRQPLPGHNPGFNYSNDSEENEDERIEKKVQAAIAAREAASERSRQEREQQEYPNKLQQMFPDFGPTISDENLDYLMYHYPEVATPLKRLPDGFDKWHDIYKAVKKFIPNQDYRKDASRAEANFNKPKSISSPSITQPGEALSNFRISEDRKAANWERMQKLLKSVG